MGVHMSQISQAGAATPSRKSRKSKDASRPEEVGERFTPLLTREAHTFACMRMDKRGPRMFSAICAPRWKQS
jgi:hypothetical protein